MRIAVCAVLSRRLLCLQYVTWAELIYIQLLTPNASFLGHLAGILAGILHVSILQYLPFLSTRTVPFSGEAYCVHHLSHACTHSNDRMPKSARERPVLSPFHTVACGSFHALACTNCSYPTL